MRKVLKNFVKLLIIFHINELLVTFFRFYRAICRFLVFALNIIYVQSSHAHAFVHPALHACTPSPVQSCTQPCTVVHPALHYASKKGDKNNYIVEETMYNDFCKRRWIIRNIHKPKKRHYGAVEKSIFSVCG